MRQSCLSLIAGTLLAAICVSAKADALSGLMADYQRARTEGRVTHALGIDNDSLLLNRDDGFYTSGLFYAQRHAMRDAGKLTAFGWRVGQELYTASDIKLPPALVGPPDHPYAGWLFGGFFKETYRADGSHVKAGIDIGCLGPCAGGEWTQKTLHRLLRQPLPQGWSRQVKNEFGVVLHADIAPVRWAPAAWIDVTPSIKGRFGNIYTDIGGGLTVRAGRLNALPDQPSLHGFVRLDARAVAYNASLQGGYFSSGNPHTVAPKRHVGEIEGGLAWNREPYGLAFSIVRRSNEVRDIPNSIGTQNFVRLQFSYTP
jgi:lipid A 3-O-deacylase